MPHPEGAHANAYGITNNIGALGRSESVEHPQRKPTTTFLQNTRSGSASSETTNVVVKTPHPSLRGLSAPATRKDTPLMKMRSVRTTLVGEVQNAAGGNSPSKPVDPPTPLALLALARRETSTEAATSTGAIVSSAPVVKFTDAVINGTTGASDSAGYPLTYNVIGTPTDGGDVLMDSATGDFKYLPNATLVDSRGTGQFDLLVAETTPLDTELESLPLVGSSVAPILVKLHQVPFLNQQLAPLIGASTTETVTIDVADVVPEGAPVARTITMTSFDGVKINRAFFPGIGPAAGRHRAHHHLRARPGLRGSDRPRRIMGAVRRCR